jgi:hypothetical protein
MRQKLSKIESDILYWIDTGCDRAHISENLLRESVSQKDIDLGIKSLRNKDLIHFEDKGQFIKARYGQHYGKEIKFDEELDVYTYENGVT